MSNYYHTRTYVISIEEIHCSTTEPVTVEAAMTDLDNSN